MVSGRVVRSCGLEEGCDEGGYCEAEDEAEGEALSSPFSGGGFVGGQRVLLIAVVGGEESCL